MAFSLAGRVALITGGSGTMGKAIASVFLENGMTVALTARRLGKLEEAKAELLHLAGKDANVHVIPSDIAKEESVIQLFQEIDKRCGRIDIVINNAGITSTAATEELTAAEMESVMGVNVTGAFLCSREAMKRMAQQEEKGGRIINVGSISGTSPRPNSVAYTTSKFAVKGLTQCLALDGRPKGICVGMIHPGNVISEMLSQEEVERREKAEGFIQPEDVAKCVLTMASLPYSANVLELTVMPTRQPLIGRG